MKMTNTQKSADPSSSPDLRPMGIAQSLAIYVPATILLFVQTSVVIPYLSSQTGQEAILFWFIVGGVGVFVPLIVTAYVILKLEGGKISADTWNRRLRFKRLTRGDIFWSIGGLAVIGLLSGLIMKGLEVTLGEFDPAPSFMVFEPLTSGRYWLLAVWFPFWTLNILGEEILWRGAMLPRQEIAFGKYAWIIHGCGWGMFHVAFGWHLLATLVPILFIQSHVVQRTKNSWTGVIIHGGLNGPSFVAIAFGLI